MDVVLRPGRPGDAEECGRICFEAFDGIARAHGFASDMPGARPATDMFRTVLGHPGFYTVVAESGGRIVGSNCLDERSPVAGVGPITVDPVVQDGGIGRRLMLDVLRRATERRAPGIRLLQSGYHCRSFALYAGLGFVFRETVACLQGPPIGGVVPGYEVRAATEADLAACDDLCRRVHGVDRGGELADAVTAGTARVTEHGGRITGYATDLSFFAHAVGETTEDVRALIAAAPSFGGPGILVPARDSALLQWCLGKGLKVQQLMSLMTVGLYNEPAGAYLPSILY
ncbi:GNAT family N-acetyltransferase [Streptomyces sp. NPDC016309]|uniref:GNAT family N-acetyltransferase n=1 Tax=Streptomyces sp. NPDC016309 TaxID=3364965 RepID=UPI003700A042